MADSSFGLKIGLEGEREFKRAITDINREMRVLGSEMKLVASSFGKNEQSAGSLTAKNQMLGREIEAQRSKVEMLRLALENSAQSFGENDARTKNWQIQLNNAQSTLNGLEGELEDNTKALDSLGAEADDTGGDLKDAAKNTDSFAGEVDDLGGQLDDTSGKTRVFGDVLKASLAAEVIIAGVKGIGRAIGSISRGFVDAMKDGVDYNARMEQYTTSFTTMLGDQAKAHQLVNDLKAEAARTPFGMEDLAKNTQTLMAFGISADEAQLRLKQLGDISQGDAVKLESLTLAFAQMSSTGKLTGQDLNQMINAGFNPLEEMSRKTGKSIGELKEEMGKGAISAQMVADAFESATAEGGRFYGAMDAQSGTFSGQMATLEDGVANLKGLLASGLSDALAGTVLPMVNGWVDELTKAFETGGAPAVITAFGTILQEALAFISEQLPMVLDAGISIITALLAGIIEVLPEVAATAVVLVVSLVEALIEALPALLEAAVQIIATLVMGISEALPELIPAAVQAIVTIVQGLADSLPLLLEAALQLIMGLAQGLLDALPVLIEALPQIIDSIITFLVGAIPMIITTGVELLTALVGALPQIIALIVQVLPQIITSIVTAIVGAVPQLIQAGVQLLTALVAALPQIITTIIAAIPQIVSSLVQVIVSSVPQIVSAGVQLLVALVQNLPQIISQIVAAIPQIITSIVGAVRDGVSRMASVGGDLVRGLWNGIQGLAGWLWDKVSGWIGGIWDGITGFFGINSPSKEMAWVGDMLTRGLAGGITQTGHRAVQAAKDIASDTMDAVGSLTGGIDVPITPVATGFTGLDLSGGSPVAGSGLDVVGLIDATVRAVLSSVNISVVLNDGLLVGRLAPGIDRELARTAGRSNLIHT